MGKNHPNVDPYVVSRVRALESLLLEKGILAPDAVDRVIERYESDTGPMVGARAVARAWTDPGYRDLLLDDAKSALGQFGLDYGMLVVVENTPAVHNLVVCTLCSCYPWPVLGLPPTWYKMPAYRSRAVSEPRKLLAELGLEVPPSRELRVWDSSAEMRYMVLPQRPAGTERLGEAELIPLVTRDALIGVAEVAPPPIATSPPDEPRSSGPPVRGHDQPVHGRRRDGVVRRAIAHEDSARRAAHAALGIQRASAISAARSRPARARPSGCGSGSTRARSWSAHRRRPPDGLHRGRRHDERRGPTAAGGSPRQRAGQRSHAAGDRRVLRDARPRRAGW